MLYDVIVAFKIRNCEKMTSNEEGKVIFLQNNAPYHMWIKTVTKLYKSHFELFTHPSYSPELAFSDYYLFADLKEIAPGKEIPMKK